MRARLITNAWKRAIDEPQRLVPFGVLIGLTYYSRLVFELEPFIEKALGFPRAIPSVQSPWYFIRDDFVEGMAAIVGLVVFLLAAFAVLQLSRMYAWMLVWMGFLFHGDKIVRSAIIYARCTHFLDPTKAVSPWATSDDYLSDPGLAVAYWVALLSTLGLAYFTRRYFPRKITAPNLFERID